MSVFQVQLQNANQGQLDIDPATGLPFTTSVQRTIYVAGPDRINRELADGQTFTDCNYWKRFAYPQVCLQDAFINVVSDDGSVWSDYELESTFLKVYNLTIAANTTYTLTANQANILKDTGGYAIFTQLANAGAGSVNVQINGNSQSIFALESGATQIYNNSEIAISLVSFANTTGSSIPVQVMVSVRSQPTS